MNVGRSVTLVALALVSQVIAGCGSNSIPAPTNSTAPSPAALTGNWNIVGNRSLQRNPLLSFTLLVDGNQLTATGDSLVQCPSGSGGGGSAGLTGQIAADGTFTLNSVSGNSFLWAITGTAPASGASTWSGSYTLTTAPTYTDCTLNENATFTATALPPFEGIYAGTLLSGSTSSPTGTVTVTVNVSQGASIMNQSPLVYLPLSGTIVVTGSPCFTSGTSSTTPGSNAVKGDSVAMTFDMNDGSEAIVSGQYTSPTDSSLSMALFAVLSGTCGQTVYVGTLTRQ